MVLSGWRKACNPVSLRVCISASQADDLKEAMDADGLSPCLSSPASALISPRYATKLRNSSITRTTCAICLEVMRTGHGQALFTAECSHAFHFACIASNVRYGSLVCPVCRCSWKEVPWQALPMKLPTKKKAATLHQAERHGSSSPCPQVRESQLMQQAEEEQQQLERVLRMLDESIANFPSESTHRKEMSVSEPSTFDDDEPFDTVGEQRAVPFAAALPVLAAQAMQITALAEENEVAYNEKRENLTVLVHAKAAAARDEEQQLANMLGSPATSDEGAQRRRAAIDLVAVLDISGSMAGTKLALMKRAMRLVVRSLGATDRLSVVAFASTARRVLALRRMTEEGRRAALDAIESLSCSGGTSIADGLRKGTAVLQQRRHANSVATIMLLSDGQDSFTMRQPGSASSAEEAQRRKGQFQIPVHTFGLGVDHDAGAMHSISEESGGTFSFLQGEGLMQDAFAQCLGGLLSVVAQRVEVEVQVGDGARLLSMETGSYRSEMAMAGSHGRVHLGDLYAHEERDLLINTQLRALAQPNEGLALSVSARYFDPISGMSFCTAPTRVLVRRPLQASAIAPRPCVELDRHRNRLRAAHAIVEARTMADRGDLQAAQRLLERARQQVKSSAAMRASDKLTAALSAEMARIQKSMGDALVYKSCGRAYALSAQSSHMRQRATMRGSEEASEGYRTPWMNTMLGQSGSMPPDSPPPGRRHILASLRGSRLARLASFDSLVRP